MEDNPAFPKKDQSSKDSEASQMMNRINEMQQDLDKKLAHLYDLGKAANVDIDTYLSPSGLSSQELKQIKERERQLSDELKKVTPKEACVLRAPKSKEKLTQERKAKFRGSRQNWIPM